MHMSYIDFIMEAEKLRYIKRRTPNLINGQRENDAEHSHHACLIAIVLEEFAPEINLEKVLKMLIIHDLVEIYSGDTFAYDELGKKIQKEKEYEAADKLYSILPSQLGQDLYNLWVEFEEMETKDSIYANAVDRLQPILMNYYNPQGGTWKEFSVSREQVEERIKPIRSVSPQLSDYMSSLLDRAEAKGYFA